MSLTGSRFAGICSKRGTHGSGGSTQSDPTTSIQKSSVIMAPSFIQFLWHIPLMQGVTQSALSPSEHCAIHVGRSEKHINGVVVVVGMVVVVVGTEVVVVGTVVVITVIMVVGSVVIGVTFLNGNVVPSSVVVGDPKLVVLSSVVVPTVLSVVLGGYGP